MRLIATLGLVGCFTTTAAVSAQQTGPLARAASREATRLAATSNDSTSPTRGLADAEWSRVRRLAPGTELMFAVEGAAPEKRIFIRADDDALTVLGLYPMLSAATRRDLIDAASTYPQDFASSRRTIVHRSVTLMPDGVFVDGRKVADRQDIVWRIPRGAIVEITKQQAPADAKIAAAILGSVVGFYAGRYIGAAVQPPCHCGDQGFAGWIIGGPVGALVGGFGGAALIKAKPVIVYRRP